LSIQKNNNNDDDSTMNKNEKTVSRMYPVLVSWWSTSAPSLTRRVATRFSSPAAAAASSVGRG
jgi:hypothetical protein